MQNNYRYQSDVRQYDLGLNKSNPPQPKLNDRHDHKPQSYDTPQNKFPDAHPYQNHVNLHLPINEQIDIDHYRVPYYDSDRNEWDNAHSQTDVTYKKDKHTKFNVSLNSIRKSIVVSVSKIFK